MSKRILGALQFLTVLPIKGSTASPGQSSVAFPAVGALLGASAGGLLLGASAAFGRGMGALLTVAFLLVATGSLHEDGLADVADAVRAGRPRAVMIAILKDSRIGTYGAVALTISIALRWQALVQMTHPFAGLVAALSLSRFALVAIATTSPAVGSGLGQAFVAECSPSVTAFAAAQALAVTAMASWWLGWRSALGLLVATCLVILLARVFFLQRLGGVTGDCLGATCQVVEVAALLVLACPYFI